MPRGRSRCGHRRHCLRIRRILGAKDSGRRTDRRTGTGSEGSPVPAGGDRRGPRNRIATFGWDNGGFRYRRAVQGPWRGGDTRARDLGRNGEQDWDAGSDPGASARAVPGAGCRCPVLGLCSARVFPKAGAVSGTSRDRGAGEGVLIPWARNRRRSEWVAAPAGGGGYGGGGQSSRAATDPAAAPGPWV